jgi:hypothetical protein
MPNTATMPNAAPLAIARPRWRFTFRLSTLFVLITIAAFVCAAPRFYRQYQFWQLKSYVNRDLRQLSAEEHKKFDRLVAKLLPDVATVGAWHQHWYLWQVSTDRGPRLVLFQDEMLHQIPGNNYCHLFLFSESGEFVAHERLTIGSRTRLHDAALIKNRVPNQVVVALETNSFFGGGIDKEFYALINDRPILIRPGSAEEAAVSGWVK